MSCKMYHNIKNIFSFGLQLSIKNALSTDMSHSKYYHPHCLNCHYPLAEFDKFCPTPFLWVADFWGSKAVTADVLIPFLLITLVAPFIALKRYYKQNWGKTLVKGIVFQFGYMFIGMIAFIIGGFISFLFL